MTKNQKDMLSESICNQPPSDPFRDSGEDLSDKECNDQSKLSRHQLLAPAHLEIERPGGRETIKQHRCRIIIIKLLLLDELLEELLDELLSNMHRCRK